jgi:hypothetical protein
MKLQGLKLEIDYLDFSKCILRISDGVDHLEKEIETHKIFCEKHYIEIVAKFIEEAESVINNKITDDILNLDSKLPRKFCLPFDINERH